MCSALSVRSTVYVFSDGEGFRLRNDGCYRYYSRKVLFKDPEGDDVDSTRRVT